MPARPVATPRWRRRTSTRPPQDDVHNPKSPNYGKIEDPQHPGKPLPAWEAKSVTLSGALASVNAASSASDPGQTASSTTSQRPYTPGSVVNLSA